MATRIADAARNAAADAVVDRIDLGSAEGTLTIKTGSQPADADDAGSGTDLVVIDLGDPAYGAASGGSAALQGTPSGTAIADGTAGWFRVEDSDGNNVFDGSVTESGGGGDLILDNTDIATGQTVTITSLPFSVPASE